MAVALWSLCTFGAAATREVAGAAEPAPAPEVVTFEAADGVRVWADLLRGPRGFAGPVVLLFHQAGSNAAEYEPIAPRLRAMGATTLAVDQRSGGRLFGSINRTATALGRPADFLEAYRDLEAALAWARERSGGGPLVVWGSSYSAASVFRLAATHPEIDAVLAFSPGEYLGNDRSVAGDAAGVRVPTFVTAGEGSEVLEARFIFDATAATQKIFYRPRIGVHGSSGLRSDRNPEGAEENWQAVARFLVAHVPGMTAAVAGGDQSSR